ncbi:hypothetical protein [Lentibacter sp. XHP0401]|jgi:hypothetical protein|uniref:hypothetical protein n=1 Tax=Lentibacter sp. XHP0401 TaxID=2984334 RepID=UPI0021E8DEBF|nr:hypothetical protein [Lentibacter sp. XHP0401]MCV2892928.1 hypothetical protein [Lentibacter sp. XHP0401]
MHIFLKVFLALGLALTVSACAKEAVWAPDEVIDKVKYRDTGPNKLTLFTMINNRSGQGAHTSLMISGSQRVIWDPAGSFYHPAIPERNDVLFGISPRVADVYTRYHARETFHVIVQEVEVSPAVAERALQLAMNKGNVGDAQCALSTSGILSQLAGFESINVGWYPKKLAEQFGALPGVTERKLYEYDNADLGAYDPSKVKIN